MYIRFISIFRYFMNLIYSSKKKILINSNTQQQHDYLLFGSVII